MEKKINIDYLEMGKKLKKEARKSVKNAMKDIEKKAKQACPEVTGDLKKSIRSGVKVKKGDILGYCGAGNKEVYYSLIVESRQPYLSPQFDRVIGNTTKIEEEILDKAGVK